MVNEVIEMSDEKSEISFQEVLQRIAEFSLEHPDKIAEWKKLDSEKYYNGVISEGRIKNLKKNITVANVDVVQHKKTEELISRCMMACPSRFVLGVKAFFYNRGSISEKQKDALERILDTSKVGEDFFG